MLAGRMSNSLCNKLVKTELLRSVYEDQSAHRVDYGEDLVTLFNLINRVDRFAHVPDPNYRYLRRPASLTVRADADALLANVKSLSLILDQILPTLTRWAEPSDLVEKFFARISGSGCRFARACSGAGCPPPYWLDRVSR